MPNFIVNRNTHEVHDTAYEHDCSQYPLPHNRVSLGWHATCGEAVNAAKSRNYRNADGCAYCVPDCHNH